MEVSYDTPFQQFTPEEETWLDSWENEGAKELTVEALQVCIDVVFPAAKQLASRLSSDEQRDFFQRWNSSVYPGTTFKEAMHTNLMIALQLNRLSRIVGEDKSFLKAAFSFLEAAQKAYKKLTAAGMPDGLRPWHRLRPRSC